MTGMKEGAGEDPFADDTVTETESETGAETEEDTEAETKAGTETDTDGETETEPEARAVADTEADSMNDSGPDRPRSSADATPEIGDRESTDGETSGQVLEETVGDTTTEKAAEGTGSESPGGGNQASESKSGERARAVSIPYKLRRDSVQDGRNRVPLFLQDETKTSERDALRELEERLDDDVSLTDLREALVIVGLERLDEVEGQLEEWGYGLTFDA